MPKKKSLWMRETPCLVCEHPVTNFQFMTKSHTIALDEWMVAHPKPLGEYEAYPDNMKTTICPKCLFASNEYSYGVDDYKFFFRSTSKNDQIREFLEGKTDERFLLLVEEFTRFQQDAAALDAQANRPENTRAPATLKMIWQNKEKYGIPFLQNIILPYPRDMITTLVCFTLDRYCQMLRIAYDYDVEPEKWTYEALQSAVIDKFTDDPLEMKQSSPRFYFIGSNYLHSIQHLEKVMEDVDGAQERHQELVDEYWKRAHRFVQLSMANDDVSAIPLETQDGGLNLLMAKLNYRFGDNDAGNKCLNFAKKYADNRMKRISSTNQQNFVNEVDDLYKQHFGHEVEEEEVKSS